MSIMILANSKPQIQNKTNSLICFPLRGWISKSCSWTWTRCQLLWGIDYIGSDAVLFSVFMDLNLYGFELHLGAPNAVMWKFKTLLSNTQYLLNLLILKSALWKSSHQYVTIFIKAVYYSIISLE